MTSYINHSCVPNVNRSFIGDFQIVRATRDMAEDTELKWSYLAPMYCNFEGIGRELARWHINCDCAICTENRSLSEPTKKQRIKFLSDLTAAIADPKIVDCERVE